MTRYLKRVSAFHPSKIYCLVKTSENSAAGSRPSIRREKKIKHKVRNTLVLCNSVWATRRGTLSGRSRKEILFLKRRRKKNIYITLYPTRVCVCISIICIYIYSVHLHNLKTEAACITRVNHSECLKAKKREYDNARGI